MKKQNIVIGVFALAAVCVSVYYCTVSQNQSVPIVTTPTVAVNIPTTTPVAQTGIQKIDEHFTVNSELRDVNFCGKTYKVKQVLIDGVDVVQRVAELATKNLIPETLKMGTPKTQEKLWKTIENDQGVITKGLCEDIQIHNINGILDVTNVRKIDDKEYIFLLTDQSFIVNIETTKIYSVSDYEGALVGPIGKLK